MEPIQNQIQQPVQSPPIINPPQPKTNWILIVLLTLTIILLTVIIFIYQQNQKLQKQVSNQQITPTISIVKSPSPTPIDDMAEWNMYKNDKFGITFLYPKNLILFDQLKQVGDNLLLQNFQDTPGRIESSNDFQLVLNVNQDDGKSLEEYPKLWESELGKLASEKIFIGKIEAIKGFSGQKNLAVPTVWLKNNGFLYIFQFSTPTSDTKQFDQILSTFKFIDQTIDTSSWKTYPPNTIVGLNYSFKYPNEVEESEASDFTYFKTKTSTLFHRYVTKVNDLNILMNNYQVFGAPVIKFTNKEPKTFEDLSGYSATSLDGTSKYYFLENIKLSGFLVFSFETKDTVAENLFKEIVRTVIIK